MACEDITETMPEPDLELIEGRLCPLAQEFLENLSRLQKEVAASAEAGSFGDANAVKTQTIQLQQHFQKIIAAIAITPTDSAKEQRLRPYQTEAHRLLRLIGLEAMKLKTAKQAATIAKGRSQLTTQLNQLQPFAQAIANEVCGTVEG